MKRLSPFMPCLCSDIALIGWLLCEFGLLFIVYFRSTENLQLVKTKDTEEIKWIMRFKKVLRLCLKFKKQVKLKGK